jgi:hypothetical protein
MCARGGPPRLKHVGPKTRTATRSLVRRERDDWRGGRTRVDRSESANNLPAILVEMRLSRLPAYVIGPAPASETAHDERIRALSSDLHAVAEGHATPCLEIVDQLLADPVWSVEACAGDGVDPARGGYSALADAVTGRFGMAVLADRRRPFGRSARRRKRAVCGDDDAHRPQRRSPRRRAGEGPS